MPSAGAPTPAVSPLRTYDALNRLTSKSYSSGTPRANFFYDQAPSSWPAWSGVSLSKCSAGLASQALRLFNILIFVVLAQPCASG